jgi:hypothetical protein
MYIHVDITICEHTYIQYVYVCTHVSTCIILYLQLISSNTDAKMYGKKLKNTQTYMYLHTVWYRLFILYSSQTPDCTIVFKRSTSNSSSSDYIVGREKVQKSGPAIHMWLLSSQGAPRARKNVRYFTQIIHSMYVYWDADQGRQYTLSEVSKVLSIMV